MVLLSTQRLLLREFEPSDWPQTHAYESDPETVRYEAFGAHTPEESRARIAQALAEAAAVPRLTYDLAVLLQEEGRLIGRCGLRIEHVNLREGMLWYIFARPFWGRGYATEAARAVLDFAFRDLGLHRVFADCDPDNAASIRVLERLGLRLEAHLRENAWIKGAWADSMIYAMLDREWPPAQAN